jgi:hypothetical protein
MGFQANCFDFVVGNPPFGGEGLRRVLEDAETLLRQPGLAAEPALGTLDSASGRAASLVEHVILGLESWRGPSTDPDRLAQDWQLLGSTGSPPGRHLSQAIGFLKRHAIEALFLERFVRLARPGGWVAVILPDGLLANDRHLRVREWVMRHAHLCAVVALPHRTFARSKTVANTSLVLLRKRSTLDLGRGGAVLFTSPDFAAGGISAHDYFEEVRAAARDETWKSGACRWIPGSEVSARRWHAGYVHPRLHLPNRENMRFPLRPLGDFIDFITYGPILTGRRVQDQAPGEVRVIGQSAIRETGIDFRLAHSVAKGSPFDLPRSRPCGGDLLLPRSGVGTLARNRLAVFLGDVPANVGCFVDIVRLGGLNPFYAWFFLKTDYGFDQIRRLYNGVGTLNLSFDEIRSLLVAVATDDVQRGVESRYRSEVLPLHQEWCSAQSESAEAQARKEAEARFRQIVEWLRGELAR